MIKRNISVFIILYLVLGNIFLTSCSKVSESESSNFNFSLEFNVNGDDILSTFDDSFRVHTIEGYKTINLTLREDDLKTVEDYIIKNNILNEDYTLTTPTDSVIFTPSEQCVLFVNIKGEEHTIEWTTSSLGLYSIDTLTGKLIPSEGNEENFNKVMILFEFRKLVEEIIYSYDESKDLAPHIGYN